MTVICIKKNQKLYFELLKKQFTFEFYAIVIKKTNKITIDCFIVIFANMIA